MKTFYIVNQNLMNGTVTIASDQTCFSTKKLAEKVVKYLKKTNKDLKTFSCIYSIKEIQLYENESEVPCLNK